MSAPTLPVGHEEYAALAVGWALDALEPADQDRFDEHRATCRYCEQEAAEALDVAVELAYGVPDFDPPAELRRRLLAVAAEEPPAQPAPRPAVARSAAPTDPPHRPTATDRPATTDPTAIDRPTATDRPAAEPATRSASRTGPDRTRPGGPDRARHRRPVRRLGPLLAAAALVAVSAVTTWQVTRPEQDRPAPAATAERVATLSAPGGDGTVATVVVGQGRIDVVTDALPPNAARRTTYLLWGVPSGNAADPRVVGSFDVTAPGLHSYAVRLVRPADGYPVLAISEEPAGTTPASPSGIIARGALGR